MINALNRQFSQSPKVFSVAASFGLLAVVGVVDYLTGYKILFSAFYLIPVALVSWYAGRNFGIIISILSVVVSVVGDYAAGAQYPSVFVPAWNGLISLTIYLVVVKTLTSLRKLQNELEDRVRQRTDALTTEMTERARLEKEILEISEREQRRIGHDLHDSLCQHWAATAMASQVLSEKLAGKAQPEADDARKIVNLAQNGITLTRNLAHGISPAEMETEGLVTAFEEFAANTSQMFKVECVFDCEAPPRIDDTAAATHLYRIAQEAVHNAIRHGKSRHIVISLSRHKKRMDLTIEDDGSGLPEDWRKQRGLGTRIMAHRAGMIGGTFSIEPNPTGGTFVKCSIPAGAESKTFK